MKSASQYIIVGGGGFARELICWLQDCLRNEPQSSLLGYLDDTGASTMDGYRYGVPWLGRIDDFMPQPGQRLIVGIGEPASKRIVVEKLKAKGGVFASLIHPSAVIASSAQLGEGVVLCPHALVSADARVGDFVTVNVLSSVGHDVAIGEFTTLSSHVDLTGWVKVGADAFFGSGARVLPELSVGDKATIGAGAVVVRSVKPGQTVYAAPAKALQLE
ncbi:acetyltransferase [Chitinimonas lacunae]|uniref:Acetyltransferase n=1 Tax=Chitinimonas lacunae TaxID=1963018 RepID=A0ABV8MSY7_9NEIS